MTRSVGPPTSAACAASGAMPGARDLARLYGLGALVDSALDLAILREQDRLESCRTDVDSKISFLLCHCSLV